MFILYSSFHIQVPGFSFINTLQLLFYASKDMHLHCTTGSNNNLFLLNAQKSCRTKSPGPSTKTLELLASLYTNLTNLENTVLIKNSFAILLHFVSITDTISLSYQI